MDISLAQIHEFTQCPMIYKFRHVMRIDRSESVFNGDDRNKYHDCVRKSIMYFYYQILKGNPPTLGQVHQKFSSLLYSGITKEQILLTNTQDSNENAANATGLMTLTNFYEREASKKFVPILVDYDANIPIGDHNLVCTIDLVRELKDRRKGGIEIVTFGSSNRNMDLFYISHHTGLTAESYAFRKIFQVKEDLLVYQHMKSGKEYYTMRDVPEYRRLEAMVNSVAGAIEREDYFPVHNTNCNGCVYRDVCNKYKF